MYVNVFFFGGHDVCLMFVFFIIVVLLSVVRKESCCKLSERSCGENRVVTGKENGSNVNNCRGVVRGTALRVNLSFHPI